MNSEPISNEIKERLYREAEAEMAFFQGASVRFLDAWKRAVGIAGVRYFQIADDLDYRYAIDKDQLRPDLALIERALGVCSPGEGIFLCAIYSFFNDSDGDDLMRKHYPSDHSVCGVAAKLDLKRRQVLADLLLNYNGW